MSNYSIKATLCKIWYLLQFGIPTISEICSLQVSPAAPHNIVHSRKLCKSPRALAEQQAGNQKENQKKKFPHKI